MSIGHRNRAPCRCKLARIRVEEDELAGLAQELSGILTFMEQLNEVDVTGIGADDIGNPDAVEAAGRCGDGWQYSGANFGQCAGCVKGSLQCRRWWNDGANTLTIAAARDALRKGELSAVDLAMSC